MICYSSVFQRGGNSENVSTENIRTLPPWNEKSSWTQHQDRTQTLSEVGLSAGTAMPEPVWYYRNRRSIREMPEAEPLCASTSDLPCSARPRLSGRCLFLKHVASSAPPTLGGLRMKFAVFVWVRVQTPVTQLSYHNLDQRHLQDSCPKEWLRWVFYWFIR